MSRIVFVLTTPVVLMGPLGHSAQRSLEAEKCAVLRADTTKMILLPSGLSLGFRADHSSSALSHRSTSVLGAGTEDET